MVIWFTETLDNYIFYMVNRYIIITGRLLMFVCVMVTSKEYSNMVHRDTQQLHMYGKLSEHDL